MKVPKKSQTREADLNFKELEELAEEIRMQVTDGEAYTIRGYVNKVRSMDVSEFGYRKGKALLFEPKLEAYFPNEVFTALQQKGREARCHKLNEDDLIFIKNYVSKGIPWLANRFYMSRESMSRKIRNMGLRDRLPTKDFEIV